MAGAQQKTNKKQQPSFSASHSESSSSVDSPSWLLVLHITKINLATVLHFFFSKPTLFYFEINNLSSVIRRLFEQLFHGTTRQSRCISLQARWHGDKGSRPRSRGVLPVQIPGWPRPSLTSSCGRVSNIPAGLLAGSLSVLNQKQF